MAGVITEYLMAEIKTSNQKKPFSADWLVRGVLVKLGDIFDRFTGRTWKPSSSLATSELIERLKNLVDAEAKELEDGRRFVPHNFKLKMQWDKFSIDSDEALRKLEVELLTALVDHINDRRYYTYAPLTLEVKPDYFTSGVKLQASFENVEDEREVSIDVTAPHLNLDLSSEKEPEVSPAKAKLLTQFEISGNFTEREFELEAGKRLTVGRTKESDIALDDPSVSKMHASLSLKETGEIVIADTGSTNGTFIKGERIPYGKAIPITAGQELRFGTVDVSISIVEFTPARSAEPDIPSETNPEETVKVGDMEFTTRREVETSNFEDVPQKSNEPEPTLIVGPASRILTPLTNEPPASVPRNNGENNTLEENVKN